ncbi:MAG TPA: ATP-binding protein [Mucilaginibacter sp.]
MRYLFILFTLLSVTAAAQNTVGQRIERLNKAPDIEKLKLYIEISHDYMADQPDSAVYYANMGLHLAEKQSNWSVQSALLLQLGRINAYHHHDQLARRFYNEALTIARHSRDVAGMANAYDELGLLDSEDQNTSSADKNLSQAMKFYHSTRDSTGILESYQRLGKVYEDKGETEKALSYYLRALAQYEHQGKKPEAYFVLLEDIGNLYIKKGNSKLALTYLQEGVNNAAKPGLRDTEISLLDEEGVAYQTEGRKDKALAFYKQAFEEAKKYRQPQEEANALINIASVLKQQNSAMSLADLKTAMGIARKLKEPKLEARIFAAMAGVYRQEKNYQEAIKALDAQHHLLDSLLKSETSKDIAALDSSYALESSYEKIGHLQLTNKKARSELQLGWVILIAVVIIVIILAVYLRKVKRLNGELKTSNKIKDTLFSVVGHDLKGPASNAIQLFDLMETEDLTPAELKNIIAKLKMQTTASLELLMALFEWGRTQLQGVKVNRTDFDPREVADRPVGLLSQQATQKNISVSNDIPENLLVYADADHFEFVIRNLLSNAIKFTYPGGRVDISALPSDKMEIVFCIADNGIGISKEQQQLFLTSNLSVKFGTGNEKGSGLGLLLAKEFIAANGGRIWIESKEGEGAKFFLALPAA